MRVGRVAVSCLHCRSIPQQETARRRTGNGNLVAIDRTPLRGCTDPDCKSITCPSAGPPVVVWSAGGRQYEAPTQIDPLPGFFAACCNRPTIVYFAQVRA